VKYFVLPCLAEKVSLTRKILRKNFLQYFPLESSLLSFKIFLTFGNIVFQENIGLIVLEKYHATLNCVIWKKEIIYLIDFIFL